MPHNEPAPCTAKWITVAVVGEMPTFPEPSLRIVHGPVTPSAWAENSGIVLREYATSSARIESSQESPQIRGLGFRRAKHTVKGSLVDRNVVRLRKSLPGVQLIPEIADALAALKSWRAESR